MTQTNWTWFDLAWPWVGLGAAAVLFFFLFATDKLRERLDVSRWRDPVWLSWLAPAAYMIHQFEEYGIDAQVAYSGRCVNFCFGEVPLGSVRSSELFV
jgi:hypothetical protein